MTVLLHDYAGHPFQVQLSRSLAARGHSVVHAYASALLTPRGPLEPSASDPPLFAVRAVPMNPAYARDKYHFSRRRSMEVAYGEAVAALVREISPEVVISSNTPTEPQWRLFRECRRLDIPFISWIQDLYSIAVQRLARKKLPVLGATVGAWYKRLERSTLRGSHGVLVITEDFLEHLRQLGVTSDRVLVFPNWAPVHELPVVGKNSAWAVEHGLVDRFCFLYSGTLAMKHNPDFIKSLALSFQGMSDVAVVVISEGPGATWLQERKQAEEIRNLFLFPYQDFVRLSEVLGTGDVLLAILESEAGVFSVPSKVLTYMCGQRPILAAIPHRNLAARTIQIAGAGLCVEPEDVHSFIAAAHRLYGDRSLRAGCGKRARQFAETHFDIARITDRFEEFICKTTNTSYRKSSVSEMSSGI